MVAVVGVVTAEEDPAAAANHQPNHLEKFHFSVSDFYQIYKILLEMCIFLNFENIQISSQIKYPMLNRRHIKSPIQDCPNTVVIREVIVGAAPIHNEIHRRRPHRNSRIT